MPERFQLSRRKGWRMPANGLSVARPGRYGNPFYIGGYHKIGNGCAGMARMTALADFADETFTLVETNQQAVAMFREYRRLYPLPVADAAFLRGHDLGCWCKLGEPCHADVLLEMANQ